MTEHIIRSASRYGVGPDQFAQEIVQGGQVPMLVGEVVRGKALALVLESAKILDESGREVDLEALREQPAEETVGEPIDLIEETGTIGEYEAVASEDDVEAEASEAEPKPS